MNVGRRYLLRNLKAILLWRDFSMGKSWRNKTLSLIPAEGLAENRKRAGKRPCPRIKMVPKAGLEPAENLEIV
jgi:hypothetical protein